MGVQIADCSLRDGGYVGNKNFPPEMVRGVMEGLVAAGIDYVETGFLQAHVTDESLVYGDSVGSRRFLPAERGRTEFVGFCDNSRYRPELLDDYDGRSFSVLKISFAKHEWREALAFARAGRYKGYQVFYQPMDAPGYTEEERAEMLEAVNEVHPSAFAIVDTFGTMYLRNLREIFQQVDGLLDPGIKVALHTHNNLGLGNALAEELAELGEASSRDVVVDGSLLGMARGAGNASTEAIAEYCNRYFGCSYDVRTIVDTIEKWVLPIHEREWWGYDLPMFVCGALRSHVDNVGWLEREARCSYGDMYGVLNAMDPALRKRYGENYRKDDFSALEAAWASYAEVRS